MKTLKHLFITSLMFLLLLASCHTGTNKTLYGTWECISEQFDDQEPSSPVPAYWLDISGTCEEINIEYREASGDLVSALTGYPVQNAKCFGNRDEISFFNEYILGGVNCRLKMDASRDTLRGTYEFPPDRERTSWSLCKVVFVRK